MEEEFTQKGEVMFEHILAAVEPSPAADAMLRCLPRLRPLGARRVTLVHVAEVDRPVFGAVANLDAHRGRLDGMGTLLEAEGFEVSIVATTGNVAEEILREAENRGATLVMVGSRGRSRARELFVGSVAWDVIRRERTPVLLYRIEPETDDAESALVAACWGPEGGIVVATDYSAQAERALGVAEGLARLGCRSFTILHVRAESDHEVDAAEDAAERQRLDAKADRLRSAGAEDVKVVVANGDPASEVLRVAEDHPGSLIVMGARGRGFAADVLLGSVSRDVVSRGRGPVLLVP